MIHRIDVRTAAAARASNGEAGGDPLGQAIRQQIIEFGQDVGAVSTARIFLIDTGDDASREQIDRAARELLADPIVEEAHVIDPDHPPRDAGSRIEIHLKPGVMDPVAASTEMALRDMGVPVKQVRTGRAYVMQKKLDRSELERIASRVLANGVIESVHFEPLVPREFAEAHVREFRLRQIPLRGLADEQLTRLSRDAHLFLSLAEMKSIQSYYREQGREPTDVELETIAQTWSEHCVHKTLKSAVDVVDEAGKPLRHYGNLIKETIFKATQELMTAGPPASAGAPFCLSVFKDNAGVIAFDDTDAICFKVETHNHPSAIEPYGGAATGVGGVIRDVLGTGLGAKPIANTDVFCVAPPDAASSFANRKSQIANLPRGVIHPKRILRQVVAGVRDYGNRMGIPTVNGAVYFDDRYLANPLVFCGCVGLIPRDRIDKAAQAGDAIVLMGGRTGRDGIHGATFSSAELTDTHADEFSHAVQIGNAITEKKVADVLLVARDHGLFNATTDLGAGGLSSAVGEMGEKLGAAVELDRVPLKYAGLRYDEIWISEAQERMLLSVPPAHVERLLQLARDEDVEATVIGQFGTERRELILNFRDIEVGRLSMQFLHHGLPMPRRKAVVPPSRITGFQPVPSRQHGLETRDTDVRSRLLRTIAHPNIASKHWIIRQYDHEVQGGSVVKPLTGPLQLGPSDAAVIRPKLDSQRGVVIACGLAPHIEDPYAMAIASIDEAIRNAICVGASLDHLAILDNFCWPSVDDEHTMGTLVAACEACYDASRAYGVPFISGKDSLHNQFTNSETGEVLRIPNTLLISAIGVIDDVSNCVTMDLKRAGNLLYLVMDYSAADYDLPRLANVHRTMAALNRTGKIASCHDVSDGGLLTAVAEMCIASGLGSSVKLAALDGPSVDPFELRPARYLIEIHPNNLEVQKMLRGVELEFVGHVTQEPALKLDCDDAAVTPIPLAELQQAWRGTLDW